MMIDANDLPNGDPTHADVCILGAGAAGIALAAELANTRTRVVVIESGGSTFEQRVQELSAGEVDADPYHIPLHLGIRRMVGGTTTVWGGRCVPLEDIDFERRDYVPESGWPISREELLPYYRRASEFCGAGAFEYAIEKALGPQAGDMVPGFSSEIVRTDNLERFSLPTDFGRHYRSVLERAPNLTVITHATCTAIHLHRNGRAVESLTVKTLAGKAFPVVARRIVLAVGALEATRLLLASQDVMKEGIGNHSGRLGRFYMCHIEGTLGELRFAPTVRNVIYGYERTVDGVYCRRRLAIRAASQRQHRIGNLMARFHRRVVVDPSHGDGILSAAYLIKRLAFSDYRSALTAAERLREKNVSQRQPHALRRHLRNVAVDLPRVAAFSAWWLRKRVLARRKIPPIVLESRANAYPLHINAEQSPDPENRVVLTGRRDRLGLPQLSVRWRMNALDRHTIETSLSLMQQEFQKSGCADLWLGEEPLEEQMRFCTPIAGHQMGTARMASAPAGGVVDENCRVHGVDNLFVSGSAVFPSTGHANPTLTVVALAMRLADDLKEK